jgi:hypothetical protein
MKSENLLTILLGLLIVISAVQAYQLINLKDAVSQGATVAASAPQAQYSSAAQSAGSSGIASSQSTPSALNNAPNMVGGC